MSKDDITRWIARHGDWMLGASPQYNSPTWSLILEANPNMRFTLYDEWFYANPTPASSDYKMRSRWDNGWTNGRMIWVENYYLSRGQDPETAFFHVGADYYWQDVTFKFYEEKIPEGWVQNISTNAEINQTDQLYRCEANLALPTTASASLIIGHPEPYHSIYLEFEVPNSGGQYLVEYVNDTSKTPSNFELPGAWHPVTILSDSTNGFTRDGVISFRMPNRGSEWKRCGISTAGNNLGKYYWIRIRCVVPPRNTPVLRGAWVTPCYRYHPNVKNANESVYLGFRSPVTSAEVELLSAGSGGVYAFEYASAVDSNGMVTGWTPLPSLSDGTNGLTRSGTISWQIPSSSTWVEGKAGIGSAPKRYWIRIRIASAPATPAVIRDVTAGGRSLYNQEVYADRYLLVVPGWDARNDKNGDGYVDDEEYTALVNPNARARWAGQARVIRAGWLGALNYVINWARSELRQVMLDYFSAVYLQNPDSHVHGLFSDGMVVPSPSPMLAAAVERDDAQGWEQNWLEAHRYLRNSGKKVGGNLGTYEVYAPLPLQQTYLQNGYYTHLYNDYVFHEHYPQGSIYQTTEVSFRRRLLNISMETGAGLEQVLQFNMSGDALQRIGGGTDATAWKRFQEHALAFFYLVQHPQRSFLNIWRAAMYGSDIETTPIGTMPKPMVYQPTAMLQVDIGQPANLVPPGFTPEVLTYRDGGGFPDNIVVGDTASSVLNGNYPKLAGKPVYPTYVFALASGTLPNRPSTTYTVFARKYTKGLVLLKMTSKYDPQDTGDDSATTHPLPGVYRRVRWDGTLSDPLTEITLRGMEGAILVDASESASPDVRVSTSISRADARPGEVVKITVTATNLTNGEVRNVVVSVPIPTVMRYRPGSLMVNGAPAADPPDPTLVQITLQSVAAGATAKVEFEVTVR